MSYTNNCGTLILSFSQILLLAAASENILNSTSPDHVIDDEPHDPHTSFCEFESGRYSRELSLNSVCCANLTLLLPEAFRYSMNENATFAQCSDVYSKDVTSDLATGMWRTLLCRLKKASAFKAQDKMTFAELFKFTTQLYPSNVAEELKKLTTKCAAIDSERVEDHRKLQKYLNCIYEAENKICDKPYGSDEDYSERTVEQKKMTKMGCPVMPGADLSPSATYCCKKRSTPFPIEEFPLSHLVDDDHETVDDCKSSFSKREMELKPEVFNVVTPNTNDVGEDHAIHSSWDILCTSACMIHQKNYTASMLNLDLQPVIKYYTRNFGKSMKAAVEQIIKRRSSKNKIYLAMDDENSNPMTYTELSGKFTKAEEKEKIPYYCKFVDTIEYERNRALQEYCFDEKYGDEWESAHHAFFVPEH